MTYFSDCCVTICSERGSWVARSLTHWLHGAESLFRNQHFLSWSKHAKHFVQTKCLLPYLQQYATCSSSEFTHFHLIYVRFILVLSSHLCLGLSNYSFLQVFPSRLCISAVSHACHTPWPSHLLRFDHPNISQDNINQTPHYEFSAVLYYALLGSDVLFNTLISS